MAQALVGTRVRRPEAGAKVSGELQYASDVYLPGMLYAKVLRASTGHARILGIDVSKAAAYPGVRVVLTAKDIPGLPKDPLQRARAVLAWDEVLFYGQPVALVVAESPSIAEEALDLIEVQYQDLPVVIDPVAAMQPGAPRVRAGAIEVDEKEMQEHSTIEATGNVEEKQHPNITQRMVFTRGDVAKGFAESDIIEEHTYRAQMVHQGYIETHNAVVDYDVTGNVTVYSSNRGQFPLRSGLSTILGIPETRIRVVATEPGGAFGSKIQPLTEALAAFGSRVTGRPVKLVMSRSEDLKAAIPAPQAVVKLKTGAKKDGSLTAVEATLVFDAGAFPGGPLLSGCTLIGGYYVWPNLAIEGYEVMTNKVSVGALRAPGTPQVTFAIESQMDIMARRLGIDPLEFRLKNAVEEGALLPNNRAYPKIGLKECLRQVEGSALWQRRLKEGKGKNRGYSLAVGGWLGGQQPAAASCALNGDGTISVSVGSIDVTGSNTAFTQIAADVFGLPAEAVRVQTADSTTAPYSGQSGGSKTMRSTGMAVQMAAQDAMRQMVAIASQRLEVSPDDLEAVDGKLRVKGSPDQALSFDVIYAMTTSFGGQPYSPILGRGNAPSPIQAPSFVCVAVELEVDPDTGEVTLHDAVIAQDVGFAVNPTLVEGQMQGGMVQSLSIGLWEELQFDDRGVLRNSTLLDYRMPTSLDIPRIRADIVQVPIGTSLGGSRGVGEPPIAAGAAAVVNAINDALGARVFRMPATAERIVAALGKIPSNE